MCIINCYLDAAKTSAAITRHQEDTCALNELLQKFNGQTVIIAGDLNADIYNRNDTKEKQIKALIDDHDLQDMTSHLGSIPTYKHVYLSHHSHVDMLLLKRAGPRVQIEPNSVNIMSFEEDKCISNTFSHVPIAATLSVNTKLSLPRGQRRAAHEDTCGTKQALICSKK